MYAISMWHFLRAAKVDNPASTESHPSTPVSFIALVYRVKKRATSRFVLSVFASAICSIYVDQAFRPEVPGVKMFSRNAKDTISDHEKYRYSCDDRLCTAVP